ncbi:MAG TPA: hypothetical protein VIJ46_01440 [Rhabdochlamydiaceae bacterium]
MLKQPGLDKRHRDEDGEIHKKRSDTLVITLRKIYGSDFLSGVRSDKKLGAVLKDARAGSLDELLKRHRRKGR